MKNNKSFIKIKDFFIKIIILIVGLSIFKIFGSDTRCIIKNQIGMPCPGCGMTRALESFINGNYLDAFYYHPLFFVIILISILFIFKNTKLGDRIWNNSKIWIFVAIVFLVVYVIRMIMYFPNVAPMNYYENNGLLNILNIIK